MIRIHYVPPSQTPQADPAFSPGAGAPTQRPSDLYSRETTRFTRGRTSRLSLDQVGAHGRMRRNERDVLALSEAWQKVARALGGPDRVKVFVDATTALGPDGQPNLQALKAARLRLRQWASTAPESAAEGLGQIDGMLARLLRRNAPGEDAGSALPPMAAAPGAIRLGRQNAEALHREGLALWKAGRHEAALDRLEAASEKAPENARLHFDRGRLLMEEGYFFDAEWALLQADELRPQHAGIAAALGDLYAQIGQRELAIEAFGRAVRLDPAHTDAQAQLGVAHYEDGRMPEAARHLQQAVALDPNHVVARFYLAQVSLQENDVLRARYQLGMLAKLAPQMDLTRFGAIAPPALARRAKPPGQDQHHWQLPRLFKR